MSTNDIIWIQKT